MDLKVRRVLALAIVGVLLVGCEATEAQIQEALEETRQVEDAIRLALAGTHAAELALTPSEPPIPPTSTSTATPEVTSTSTPPAGRPMCQT